MQIAVVGTGYVGLVAGTCFAETGNTVVCVDIDQKKVEQLRQGLPTIFEPGLKELMNKNLEEKRLSFTTDLAQAIDKAKVIFMAVGTPSLPDGSADLKAVKIVAEQLGKLIKEPKIIVNKSTVPVGTAAKMREWIGANAKVAFTVVSNPEFLKEGSALDDFLKPDRVVIGTDNEDAWTTMKELYEPFVRQGNPILRMSNVSAEVTKYASNAMLATKISFINEISLLCDKVGGDIESVRSGITTDVRIGRHFLYPGAGYGGSCFPKDVKALLFTGKEQDLPMHVIAAAEKANERQKKVLFEKIEKHFGGKDKLRGLTFAIWGLAFKPNTDDMREAPSLILIEALIKSGAKVKCFDPIAHETAPAALSAMGLDMNQIEFSEHSMDAVKGSEALVLVTEWNEFRNVDFDLLKSGLKKPVIFDGRNIWKPENMKKLGFTYYGIGRRV